MNLGSKQKAASAGGYGELLRQPELAALDVFQTLRVFKQFDFVWAFARESGEQWQGRRQRIDARASRMDGHVWQQRSHGVGRTTQYLIELERRLKMRFFGSGFETRLEIDTRLSIGDHLARCRAPETDDGICQLVGSARVNPIPMSSFPRSPKGLYYGPDFERLRKLSNDSSGSIGGVIYLGPDVDIRLGTIRSTNKPAITAGSPIRTRSIPPMPPGRNMSIRMSGGSGRGRMRRRSSCTAIIWTASGSKPIRAANRFKPLPSAPMAYAAGP